MKNFKFLVLGLVALFAVNTVNAQTSPAKKTAKVTRVEKRAAKADTATAKKVHKKAAKKLL